MFKRMLSLLLCMVMVLSALPVQAIAQETAEEPTTESVESEMETIAPVEAATEPTEETTVPAAVEEVVAEATGSDIAMAAATSGMCGDNLNWLFDEDSGILTISGIGEMEDYIKAPWYDKRNVISAVDICDGVTSIGCYAFADCMNLSTVSIPESLVCIGEGAFNECDSLINVVIPDSVTSIGNSVFYFCKNLSKITLSNKLTEIPESAFEFCVELSEIAIPNSITKIGDKAFDQCHKLSNIEIPNGVTDIGESAFFATGLEHIELPESVTTLGNNAFSIRGLKSITLSEKLISIPPGLLMGCEELTSIILSPNIESIDMWAFRYCSRLSEISIPASVNEINYGAFSGCSSLNTIRFLGDAPVFTAPVPEYTMIDHFEGVSAIAYYPANNPTWTSDVMQNYGGSITWIPYENESNIASGICGENLTWVLNDEGTLTITGTGEMYDFVDVKDNGIYFPGRSPWYDYKDQIKQVIIEEGVTRIGHCAFCLSSALEEVSIPDGVISIGEWAFDDCINLNVVVLPDSLKTIEQFAFSGAGLLEITIPDSVTKLEGNAFSGCRKLTTVKLSENITEISSHVFSNCGLKQLEIPSSVTVIWRGAFYNCTALTEIVIPESIIKIMECAFLDCTDLQRITFKGDAPEFYIDNPSDEPQESDIFGNVVATAYYPAGNPTWTSDVKQNYGGNITWVAYDPDPPVEYTYGQSAQIKLIEPWGLKANAKISTAAGVIDYSSLYDYGVYFIRKSALDRAGLTQATITAEDILNDPDALKKTKADGVTVSGAYLTAIYDRDIYTYQLADSVFVMFYFVTEEGADPIYVPIRERNLKDLAEARKDDAANFPNEKERIVYGYMVDLFGAITNYREDYFRN